MRNIKASSRYAKALLDLSIESKSTDKVYADIISLNKTISGSSDLQSVIDSPIIDKEKKQAVFKAIFSKSFTKLTTNYIDLLVTKKREALLPEIINQFINQYKKHNNILVAEVTTAIKLDAELKNKILSLIKHEGTIEIIEKIDASLIGGFILKMGDKQIDASIAKRFKDLRKEIILN